LKTVLGSGNVVFSARSTSEPALQQKRGRHAGRLGQAFVTSLRPIEQLRKLLATDPYQRFKVDPKAKRIVTFLRGRPKGKIALPIEMHGARHLSMEDGEIFSAYLPTPKGPVFHDLSREDVWQGPYDADLGYGREGRAVTICLAHVTA